MAGGKLEASADLGPAWAHVVFGADGIVFFDPFWLDVACVRTHLRRHHDRPVVRDDHHLDQLGAEIHVSGPKFHGEVAFEIGPVDLTRGVRRQRQRAARTSTIPTFVRKYLEEGPDGAARALSSITGRGHADPASPGPAAEGRQGPDGSARRPVRWSSASSRSR